MSEPFFASMATLDITLEKRRQANREAQRTYRKSILKRLEDLETRYKKSGHHVDSTFDAQEMPSCPPVVSDIVQVMQTSPIDTDYIELQPAIPQHPATFPQGEAGGWCRKASNIERKPLPFIDVPKSIVVELDDVVRQTYSSSRESLHMAPLQSPSHHHNIQPKATPLHKAVHHRHEDIVRLLLQHNADIHALNAQGQTALHVAVEIGEANLMWILVEAGADVNAVDANGDSSLDLAIVSGNVHLVELLLRTGANANSNISL